MKRAVPTLLVLFLVLSSNSRADAPSWLQKPAPLPAPSGTVVRVSTADEFVKAAETAERGSTIFLADGEYKVPRVVVLSGRTNITIRSASGDPARVVLRGAGWDSKSPPEDILHVAHCDGITLVDLTFADARSYGVKVEAENGPRNVRIYHCDFRDIGVRALKGSAGQDPALRAVKGSVRFCSFRNTKIPPSDWLYGGDYIAAIDMMALEDWTFSDNVFEDIRGHNGGGRAAIFIWVRSSNVVVERNIIVNCDRGIAFGNPGQSTANIAGTAPAYVSNGVIRNNFIVGGADCGIELWHSEKLQVYNNSIWRGERNWARGIRVGTGVTGTEISNNLVHGQITQEGGKAELKNNLTGRIEEMFVNPQSGDLRLKKSAADAIDKGLSLPGAAEDIRGRKRDDRPDLGAWERLNK